MEKNTPEITGQAGVLSAIYPNSAKMALAGQLAGTDFSNTCCTYSLGLNAHAHRRPDGLNSVWCQQQKQKELIFLTHALHTAQKSFPFRREQNWGGFGLLKTGGKGIFGINGPELVVYYSMWPSHRAPHRLTGHGQATSEET